MHGHFVGGIRASVRPPHDAVIAAVAYEEDDLTQPPAG